MSLMASRAASPFRKAFTAFAQAHQRVTTCGSGCLFRMVTEPWLQLTVPSALGPSKGDSLSFEARP